jgi:hypothetical protein
MTEPSHFPAFLWDNFSAGKKFSTSFSENFARGRFLSGKIQTETLKARPFRS